MFGWLKSWVPWDHADRRSARDRKRKADAARNKRRKKRARNAARKDDNPHAKQKRGNARPSLKKDRKNNKKKGNSAAETRRALAAPRPKPLSPPKTASAPAATARPVPPVASTPPAPEPLKKGIAAYGLLNAPIGLGEAARRGIDALKAAGVPVSAHAVDLKDAPFKVPYPVADEAPVVRHGAFPPQPGPGIPDAVRQSEAARKIAVWHWELPVFPPRWMADTSLVNEVWAPSRFIAESIGAATRLPIRIVPHPAVATPVEPAAARQRLGLPLSRGSSFPPSTSARTRPARTRMRSFAPSATPSPPTARRRCS